MTALTDISYKPSLWDPDAVESEALDKDEFILVLITVRAYSMQYQVPSFYPINIVHTDSL